MASALRWLLRQLDHRPDQQVEGSGFARRVFNLESMATEELWFTEWEFGERPLDPKIRAQFAVTRQPRTWNREPARERSERAAALAVRVMIPEGNRSRGGYPASAFARLASVQDGNYWFEARSALIVWALQRYFPAARSVLDVGCGTGFVLSAIQRAFPTVHLAGTDFLEEGLAFARQRVPSASLYAVDAHELVLPHQYDVVGAFDVLEHIDDDLGVLRRMHALMKPDGGLLIAVPQHRWLWSSADDQAHHVRRYTRRELVDRVTAAGFTVLRTTSFVSLLLPLMALARWRDARKTQGPAASELYVSPSVNATLRAVLTLERGLIRSGLSFPAGGSLLLIARR